MAKFDFAKINLNDTVLVRLTGYGINLLYEQHSPQFVSTKILDNNVMIMGLKFYKMKLIDVLSLWRSGAWKGQILPIEKDIIVWNDIDTEQK